ncbi:MAG: iron ABC transporter permease [Candidatus Orphnella occulta]|nr:iron ABC transporter permease [Candidatus Orphnella occulta]MDP8297616.1 iron ABC transporter permease [Candidatus Orphnella occulta]
MDKKHILIFISLSGILVIVFVLSNLVGSSQLTFSKSIYYLFHPNASGMGRDIIWQIRFPRVMLGLLVGAGLACCGVVFQGLLRNPLAEPYTLGVSGGAALGVSISVVFAVSTISMASFAFLGSTISIFLVYAIALRKRFSNTTLILGGVILNFLFSSLVFLIFSISRAEDVHGIVLWLMGDLSSAQVSLIKFMPFFIFPAICLLFIFSRDLNILTLGEEKARHLGVDSNKVKKVLFLTASCITGICVCASGVIGFIGLIVPHFMRKVVGVDHRLLLPASCIAGAIFLIFCDILARVIIQPLELPVGVITGIFGGIFFLCFLLKSKHLELF